MRDKPQLIIKVLLTINVILICALIIYNIAKSSSPKTEKVYTQDLSAEKIRLEIEKLNYELKIYKEQDQSVNICKDDVKE